jgi:hypothetical protein
MFNRLKRAFSSSQEIESSSQGTQDRQYMQNASPELGVDKLQSDATAVMAAIDTTKAKLAENNARIKQAAKLQSDVFKSTPKQFQKNTAVGQYSNIRVEYDNIKQGIKNITAAQQAEYKTRKNPAEIEQELQTSKNELARIKEEMRRLKLEKQTKEKEILAMKNGELPPRVKAEIDARYHEQTNAAKAALQALKDKLTPDYSKLQKETDALNIALRTAEKHLHAIQVDLQFYEEGLTGIRLHPESKPVRRTARRARTVHHEAADAATADGDADAMDADTPTGVPVYPVSPVRKPKPVRKPRATASASATRLKETDNITVGMLKNIIKTISKDFDPMSPLANQLRTILGDRENNSEVDAATIKQVVRATLPQCIADLQIGTDLSIYAVRNAIRNCRRADEPTMTAMTDGGRRRARVARVPASPRRRRVMRK